MNARATALRTLFRMQASAGYASLSLDAVLRSPECAGADPRDRALLTTLVMGVIRRQTTLDYYIDRLVTPGTRLEDEVRMLLRLGLYQLIYLDRVPPHAAVSETVSLAPRRVSGLVNAVLRAYLRRGAEVPLPRVEDGEAAYLAVKYSFPEPLCRRLLCDYELSRLEPLLSAMSCEPELTLRVNTLRTTREDYLARLREAGIEAAPTKFADSGIRLGSRAVTALPGFEDGDFMVQDEASQLCVAALDARPGMRVLDICSAPGSKAFGAAMCMGGQGSVTCFDLHKSKLSLISSGAARLGIDIIDTAEADGRRLIPELVGTADRVLCDAPCSGYGVMAKKPEIRHKDPSASAGLPEIQLAMLDNCCRYVRRSGVLVYSTCTLLRAENEEVTAKFLADHPEFAPMPFALGGHDAVAAPTGRLALAPDTHGTDGFFIAKFLRN